MLTGAFGTLFAALLVIGASSVVGGGILVASGRREWSWAAPAVGLAAITVLAWWTVRLPGHATTALACLLAAAAIGAMATTRLEGFREAVARGAPVLLAALALTLIPFAAEGHFGVLGTGFNVDMSQHLFAADWLADPAGSAPGLYEQGYPLGPHALAVAASAVGGELATAFSGITIAAPVLVALAALSACAPLGRARAGVVAVLAAFAYLAASYLAQGSFKELYEAAFLIGFALLLAEVSRPAASPLASWARAGLPFGVLAAGALYVYSTPGLAWLVGMVLAWAAIELFRGRSRVMRPALGALAAALATLLVLAAPELDRIIDFGGSVGTVSERAEASPMASSGAGDAGTVGAGDRLEGGREFDDDLGNLFGQISPLEAFGVWPSGDFRVAPGDGAVPAPVFYAGAVLGAIALGLGIVAAVRRRDTALLAALAAAAAIWLAVRIGSTPYTTAKALMMIAPVAMLISARGLLDPAFLRRVRERREAGRVILAVSFVAAAALSSALAMANAPVGPGKYTPGVFELSDEFAGRTVLLLVPDEVLAGERGEEFYGWELRNAKSFSIEPVSRRPPATGFDYVIRIADDGEVEIAGGG